MKRKLRDCGQRPKAFWGAVIGAVASLASSAIAANAASNNQKRVLQAQKEEQERQNDLALKEADARNFNNYFASIQDDDEDDRIIYKKGGRRRLRNAAHITDGGYAIPLDNNTFLLRGASHNQINESGNTGIGIKVGNKEVEAQDGEVARNVNENLYIYSNEPMYSNGDSPAKRVLKGDNPNKVFAEQEAYKRTLNSPIKKDRKKAEWGLSVTGGDWIGLGADALSSLGTAWIKDRALRGININYTLPEYTDEVAVSLDTKYNNSAQRANVERNRLNTRRSLARNTASSSVALDRMNLSDTDAMLELNKLWDEKANKEVELRNKNKELEQQVRARNAANRNRYYEQVASIRNSEIDAKSKLASARGDVWSAGLSGLGTAASNFLTQAAQRYQDENALAAYIAGSENGTFARFLANGGRAAPRIIAQAYNSLASEHRDPVAPPVKPTTVKPMVADYTINGVFDKSAYDAAMSSYNSELAEYNTKLSDYKDYKNWYDTKNQTLGLYYNKLTPRQILRYGIRRRPGIS